MGGLGSGSDHQSTVRIGRARLGWTDGRLPSAAQQRCGCSCAAATLTSYSENVERGGKYGEGSRGHLKQWHSQKAGMDSFLYRLDENMAASTYSLNKIPERNLESLSSHSAHSIPLYLLPRPNSVAGESLRPSCPSCPSVPPPPPPLRAFKTPPISSPCQMWPVDTFSPIFLTP